jgi:hypothetical protein
VRFDRWKHCFLVDTEDTLYQNHTTVKMKKGNNKQSSIPTEVIWVNRSNFRIMFYSQRSNAL